MSKLPDIGNVDTLFAHALEAHQAGKLDEAEVLYEKILALDNKHVNTLTCLGTIHLQRGRREAAIHMIGRSLEINPNQPHAHYNVAIALRDLGRAEEALASYNRAVDLKPDYAEAYYNRGVVLHDQNRLDEALASYDRAITLAPDYAAAYSNRGNVLLGLKRPAEAVVSFDRAIALDPRFAEAHYNRGNTLQELNRPEEALASYGRAIDLKPDYAEAYCNRGIALQELNRPEEALASYESAYSHGLDDSFLTSSWLYCKMLCCNWTDFDADCARITNAIDAGEKAFSPLAFLAIFTSPAQQQRCAQIFSQENI